MTYKQGWLGGGGRGFILLLGFGVLKKDSA